MSLGGLGSPSSPIGGLVLRDANFRRSYVSNSSSAARARSRTADTLTQRSSRAVSGGLCRAAADHRTTGGVLRTTSSAYTCRASPAEDLRPLGECRPQLRARSRRLSEQCPQPGDLQKQLTDANTTARPCSRARPARAVAHLVRLQRVRHKASQARSSPTSAAGCLLILSSSASQPTSLRGQGIAPPSRLRRLTGRGSTVVPGPQPEVGSRIRGAPRLSTGAVRGSTVVTYGRPPVGRGRSGRTGAGTATAQAKIRPGRRPGSARPGRIR